MGLFIPTYFSPIVQYAEILKCKNITFETQDNFQKQTYRNRCYIYGANGKLRLNIPLKKNSSEVRLATKDVRIDDDYHWQQNHLKSLKSAYESSPFFEFYIDDLLPIFKKKHTYLLDLNLECHEFVMDALQEEITYSKTTTYIKTDNAFNDFRRLANAKINLGEIVNKYTQVFDDKYGFIPNLSILDLLFMEGPNSVKYLTYI